MLVLTTSVVMGTRDHIIEGQVMFDRACETVLSSWSLLVMLVARWLKLMMLLMGSFSVHLSLYTVHALRPAGHCRLLAYRLGAHAGLHLPWAACNLHLLTPRRVRLWNSWLWLL